MPCGVVCVRVSLEAWLTGRAQLFAGYKVPHPLEHKIVLKV